MAVSLLDSWTSAVQANTLAKTISAGTNRVLIVYAYKEANESISSVTYGGQTLTLIGNTGIMESNGYGGVYYLNEAGIVAASGTTITVNWSGSGANRGITAAVYENVDQTTIFFHDKVITELTPSTTIPITSRAISTKDNMLVCCGSTGQGSASATAPSPLTERRDINPTSCHMVVYDYLGVCTSNPETTVTYSAAVTTRAAMIQFELMRDDYTDPAQQMKYSMYTNLYDTPNLNNATKTAVAFEDEIYAHSIFTKDGAGDTFTLAEQGHYLIMYSVGFTSLATGRNGLQASIFVNGVEQNPGQSFAYVRDTNNNDGVLSGFAVIETSAINQTLEIRVGREGTGTTTLSQDIVSCTLQMVRLDDTFDYARVRKTGGAQAMPYSGYGDVDFETDDELDSGEFSRPSNSTVRLLGTGWYLITYTLPIDNPNTTGDERLSVHARLEADGNPVGASYGYVYLRANNSMLNGSISVIIIAKATVSNIDVSVGCGQNDDGSDFTVDFDVEDGATLEIVKLGGISDVTAANFKHDAIQPCEGNNTKLLMNTEDNNDGSDITHDAVNDDVDIDTAGVYLCVFNGHSARDTPVTSVRGLYRTGLNVAGRDIHLGGGADYIRNANWDEGAQTSFMIMEKPDSASYTVYPFTDTLGQAGNNENHWLASQHHLTILRLDKLFPSALDLVKIVDESVEIPEGLLACMPAQEFENIEEGVLALVTTSGVIKVVNETVNISEDPLSALSLTRLINEVENITEQVNRKLSLTRIINETENIAEAISKKLSITRIINETENIAENITKTIGMVKTINENENISELILKPKSLFRHINETVNIIENTVNPRSLIRILNENENISELISRLRSSTKIINETVNISETIVQAKGIVRSITESVNITENTNIKKIKLKIINEIISISENVVKLGILTRIQNETVNIIETIVRKSDLTRIINETVNIVENINTLKNKVKTINETVNISENIVSRISLNIIKIINETVNVNEIPLPIRVIVRIKNEFQNILEKLSKGRIFLPDITSINLTPVGTTTISLISNSTTSISLTGNPITPLTVMPNETNSIKLISNATTTINVEDGS